MISRLSFVVVVVVLEWEIFIGNLLLMLALSGEISGDAAAITSIVLRMTNLLFNRSCDSFHSTTTIASRAGAISSTAAL